MKITNNTNAPIEISLPPFMVPAMATMDDAAVRAELVRVLAAGLAPYVESGAVTVDAAAPTPA